MPVDLLTPLHTFESAEQKNDYVNDVAAYARDQAVLAVTKQKDKPEQAATHTRLSGEACGVLAFQAGEYIGRTALRAARSPEDVEDIIQNVHIKVQESIHGYVGGSGYLAWLNRVVHGQIADHMGKKGKIRAREFLGLLSFDEIVPSREDDVSAAEGPDAARIYQEVHAAISKLTPREQEVVRYRLLLDLSTEQTAQILGSNENAVKQRLFTAKKKLVSLLGHLRDRHDFDFFFEEDRTSDAVY